VGTNDLLGDFKVDGLSRVQFLQCDLELHADFRAFSLLLCMMMSGATAKELRKDIEWVVEARVSLRMLLQSFFTISVIDVLLFAVRENLIGYGPGSNDRD
jgi:hypothetical protein